MGTTIIGCATDRQLGPGGGFERRLTWPRDLRKSVRTEDAEMEWSGKVSFKGRAAVALKDLSSCVIIILFLPRTDKECVNYVRQDVFRISSGVQLPLL